MENIGGVCVCVGGGAPNVAVKLLWHNIMRVIASVEYFDINSVVSVDTLFGGITHLLAL